MATQNTKKEKKSKAHQQGELRVYTTINSYETHARSRYKQKQKAEDLVFTGTNKAKAINRSTERATYEYARAFKRGNTKKEKERTYEYILYVNEAGKRENKKKKENKYQVLVWDARRKHVYGLREC